MTDITAQSFSAPPTLPATAINVGDVFTRARHVFVARWATYLGIMALGYVPLGIVYAMGIFAATHPDALRESQNQVALVVGGVVFVVGVIVMLLCSLVAPGAIYFGITQQLAGRSFSFADCFGAGFRRSLIVLAAYFMIGILGMLGMVLLIVPGFIIFCVYSVAIPACMAERIGPIKAMSRSAFLTKGNRWRVFGIFALLSIIGGIFEQTAASGAASAVGAYSLLIALPVDVAVGAFKAVVIGVLYYHLRVVREGIDIEQIVKVFD
jgi:hypothetical protein